MKEIKNRITYHPRKGQFIWKDCKNSKFNGRIAGSINDGGYILVTYNGKNIKGHRLAWFFYYGIWPKNMIDHKNGIKTDNRIKNLREVTNRQNQQNRKNHRNGRLVGACFKRTRPNESKRWMARIRINKKLISLGDFYTELEAHNAYKKECRRQGKNCTSDHSGH